MANPTVVKVEAFWDAQDPENEGWYARTYRADGYEGDDSQKISFPVDLDGYARDDRDEVHAALAEAFPGVEVEVR